jgi:hypothetical protein
VKKKNHKPAKTKRGQEKKERREESEYISPDSTIFPRRREKGLVGQNDWYELYTRPTIDAHHLFYSEDMRT